MRYFRLSNPAWGDFTFEVSEDDYAAHEETRRVIAAARRAYPGASGDLTLTILPEMTPEEYAAIPASESPIWHELMREASEP